MKLGSSATLLLFFQRLISTFNSCLTDENDLVVLMSVGKLYHSTVLGLSVWGGSLGSHGFGLGHSIGTTTGLLRTALCKSLVLMSIESNSSKNTQNMHAKKSSVRIVK